MTIKYLKEHLLEFPEIILKKAIAIYVYGSVARNDSDNDSDCDLLVCVDDCSEAEFLLLKSSVSSWEKNFNCEFAFYRMSTLKEMQKKGSYFLWHIKQEGVLLYEQSFAFQELLFQLPSYTGTKSDFLEYSEILDDINKSVLQDNTTIEYDLSVLAVLARNICIGCCYLLGNMDFGRKSPVIKCINFWGAKFPFSLSEYEKLYDFRLAITRGKEINKDLVTEEYIACWLKKIHSTLSLALSLCEVI